MDERRIWELTGKINAGEASDAEKEELNNLLRSFPGMAKDIETLSAFWARPQQRSEPESRRLAFEKLMLRIQQLEPAAVQPETKTTKTLHLKRWLSYAAAAAAVLLTVVAVHQLTHSPRPLQKEMSRTIAAAAGTKSHFVLPDGSKVWLNAGSSLSYNPGEEKDSVREVRLSGEAYFEVVHREGNPFIIHTAQMDIRDIGTSFNVRAYPEESFSEATLIEGSIEVSFHNKKEKTVLSLPHQKVTLYNDGDSAAIAAEVSRIHPEPDETAWMNDVMVFKNETFGQLALRMERYYDISIHFEDDSLKNRRVTGTFSNETFEQALAALQLIIRFHYTVDGRQVSIGR